MRPVKENKGGRGSYPYHLGFDYNSQNLIFENATVVEYLGPQPTLGECLHLWLEYAKSNNKQIQLSTQEAKDFRAIVPRIVEKVELKYKMAALPLTTQIGSFCSYCEIPLLGDVPIEHIAPKAQYPLFSLDWENFLISCVPCNSVKGSQPTRGEMVDYFFHEDPPPFEKDYYDELRLKYLWPDTAPSAYADLVPQLEYKDDKTGRWLVLAGLRSVSLDMRVVGMDINTRTVKANIHIKGVPNTVEREVRVMLRDMTNKGTLTENLYELNSAGSAENTFDRRLMRRTQTWFSILGQLNGLKGVTKKNEFEDLWKTTLTLSTMLGFYSLWVWILDLTQMRDPNKKLLVTRFVQETNVALYYPNTETSQLP